MTPEQRREYNQRYYYRHQAEILAQKKSIYVPRTNRRKGLDKGRARLRVKKWREKRREHVRRTNQAWYARVKADPVLWTARQLLTKAWRETNREAMREHGRKWSKSHKHKRRLKARLYRSKRRGAAGRTSWVQWQARYSYYGGCCAYCGIPIALAVCTKDHVKAVKCGGSNWPANLVPACKACNSKKRDHLWIPRPVWAKEA